MITALNHWTCDALMAGLMSDFTIVSVKTKTVREAMVGTIEDSISPF